MKWTKYRQRHGITLITTPEFEEVFKTRQSRIIFGARNLPDLITEMRHMVFDMLPTNKEHMKETAEAFIKWDGSVIRTDTEEHFVSDLMDAKYLRIYRRPQKAVKTRIIGRKSKNWDEIVPMWLMVIGMAGLLSRFFLGVIFNI
tara:strand:+ start:5813 stop:6244 length:432 start_codon:yes stop_codon:yes gene_type:complete